MNNNNASLYILNHSDKDLCLQLNKDDGTSEERIIKLVKNESFPYSLDDCALICSDFVFPSRIGDYLFVDFDEIDFSDMANLTLQNARYIIVIGEIIGEND